MALVTSGLSYDVFLSFKGEDTRHGFTGNLCYALCDRGIRTFMKGEEITPSLLKAIKESKIAIVVLSKNYASSSFCLQELSKILDCSSIREKRRLVLPVFYDVDPSDVRNLSRTYGEAMAMHEARYNDNVDKLQKWKNALHQVANLPDRYHYNNRIGYDELDLIEMIADEVSSKLEVLKILQRDETKWRLVGLVSSVVGLLCYALNPSFNRVFEGWKLWNSLKFILYGVLTSSVTCTIILLPKKFFLSTPYVQITSDISFVVLMIISAYPFYYDLALNGKPETLSLVTNVAFALVSLSLSKLDPFGFETRRFSYFVACFAFQLGTIDWKLIFVAIIFGFPLFCMLRYCEDDYTKWRLVGLVSSVVGTLSYALSPSFKHLIGRWNSLKFIIYGVLSLVICITILFAKKPLLSTEYVQLRSYISFAVLMIISVYSFYYEKAVNGKPETLNLISNAAFALVSLSLSKLMKFGFEMGIFSYFLGCLTVQLWTIDWKLIFVAIIFGFPLFRMHFLSVSQREVCSSLLMYCEDDYTKWRLVGLVSSVVGLLSYALSPSFKHLIGRWNSLKFIIYGVLSLVICITILFAKKPLLSTQYVQLRSYISFAILMIISVYSFYYDKAVNGKPEILSLVSNVAFALVSLSLSKLVQFGFEMGIFSYFLGCFAVQLWTIDWKLILVAIIFGFLLFRMHSPLDSRREVCSSLNSEPEVDSAQVFNSLSSDSDPEVRGGRHHVIDIHT